MKSKLVAAVLTGVILGFTLAFFVRPSDAQGQAPAKKPAWEFKVVALKADPQAELTPLANDGWDLVSVAQGPWEGKMATLAFLKRPKAATSGATTITTGKAETTMLPVNG